MLERTWKRVGHGRERWEKGKKRRYGKSINLLVQLVTELLTKYCMVAYECNVRQCANVYHSNRQLTA